MRIGLALFCSALFAFDAYAAPQLSAATAPDARSVAVGSPATVFATILNTGDETAQNCAVAKAFDDTSPTVVSYQTVDNSNQLVGTANTPIDIPASGRQGFLVVVTPTGLYNGRVALVFDCNNGSALGLPGINDLQLTAESGSPPDLVTILVTPSDDGVVRVDQAGGAAAAGGAVVNIGGGPAQITASPVLLGLQADTDLQVDLCLSNPATGACIGPRASAVDLTVGNSAQTFSVFLLSDSILGVPLYPGEIRLGVEFRDQSNDGRPGTLRGSSSVAYTAPSAQGLTPSNSPLLGRYSFVMRDEDDDPGGLSLQRGDIFFDETGRGVGAFDIEFGVDTLTQVFVIDGIYDYTNPGQPTLSGTLHFMDSPLEEINFARSTITLNFDVLSGMRGSYAFDSISRPGEDVSGTSSYSYFTDVGRISAIRTGRRPHYVECPTNQLNPFDGAFFRVFFGTRPEPDQIPDGYVGIGTSEARDPDNPEATRSYGLSDATTSPDEDSYIFVGDNIRLEEKWVSGADAFHPYQYGEIQMTGAQVRLPNGTLLQIEFAYVDQCSEDGFSIVAISGDKAFAMHFQRIPDQ